MVKYLHKLAFLGTLLTLLLVRPALAEENPLDFKQSSNAWVVWTEYSNGSSQIVASKWDENKWGDALVVSDQPGNIAPSVAIDSNGNPWVVWARMQGLESTIYVSSYDGKKWSREQALTSANGREDVTPSIAFNQDGEAIVAWGSAANRSSDIRVREWNGKKWGEVITLTQEDSLPDMVPAAGFDSKGNAVVVWVSTDLFYNARLASSWKMKNKAWSEENELTSLGATEFGEDLPTLKLEGESLKLFFEDSNQLYASTWNGKNWTEKKLVDLSNRYYEIFEGLKGNPQGRAWFAWKNQKGKANSLRYNIVTHDVHLAKNKPGAFHYISRIGYKALRKVAGLAGWVLGEKDVYAGGGGGGGGDKVFGGTKGATGDSITAGSPGTGWVPFWAADVQNTAVGGTRATAALASLVRRINQGTQVLVILCGTNDAGDGRSTSDILNALVNAAINVGQGSRGINTSYLCTGVPRLDGFASRVERLAQAIRTNGSAPTIETFSPLNGNKSANAIDGPGHLTEQGAMAVGKIVRRAAFPRN